MSTQTAAVTGTTSRARGCPVPPKAGKKMSEAALQRIMVVERLNQLPENPEIDSLIRVTTNERHFCPHLKRKGYEYENIVKRGKRTADWLIFKYIGTTPTEPEPAAPALP